MRRSVALVVFVALTSSQLVALRCDMGASAHLPAAEAHEVATHESDPAHRGAHAAGTHGTDRDSCQMMMACGAASIRAVRTVAVGRISTPFVRAASVTAAIPVAADLAVETPPPRLTV